MTKYELKLEQLIEDLDNCKADPQYLMELAMRLQKEVTGELKQKYQNFIRSCKETMADREDNN